MLLAAELIVLGIAQDAGVPQSGCTRDCCAPALADPRLSVDVACIGLVDGDTRILVDATPTIASSLARLDRLSPRARDNRDPGLDAILLTHAHIGHYAGLMHLGREVMGARGVPVLAMPRMAEFLEDDGPWSQLVSIGNIRLERLAADVPRRLSENIRITPWLVPHRDEYSETVGFLIQGPRRRVLYLPDVDKWERWERSLGELLPQLDRAYVDGTFFDLSELPGRAIEEIPHPFMVETLDLVAELPASERAKLRFIHLNHGNPALRADGAARAAILEAGCAVAEISERYEL